MKALAKLISFIFGPFVWPITLIIVLLNSHLRQNQLYILLLILIFFQVIIPYSFILKEFLNKNITDLDITVRQERYKALIITLFSFFISFMFVYFLGNTFVIKLILLVLIIIFVNVLITFFWKISLHMMVNISSIIIINYLYHWQLPILFLIIPLVFWSRLYLKKHDVWQLIGAFLISGSLTLFFIFFGL